MSTTTPILDLRDLPPVEENVPRPATASQTLLAHIDKCARSGYLYMKYRGSVQTAPMARGQLGHEGFERITRMAIEADEISVPPEVGKETMQGLIEEHPEIALPEDEHDALRGMGWNFAEASRFDSSTFVGTEMMFVTEINGWLVRGKIDLLNIAGTEAFVDDYKTSINVQPKEDFERSFQTKIYGLLVAEGVPVPDDYEDADDLDRRADELREIIANETPLGRGLSGFHLREKYPRHVREDDNTLVDRYLFMDRAQLHDFRRTVEAHLATLDHGLETGFYDATPGDYQCSRCPARHECPLPEHLRGRKQIGSPGEAAEVAVRAAFMDDELGELREVMKAWADENPGPLPAGTDREFSYKLQSSYSLRRKTKKRDPKQELLDFIREHDGEPDDYFEQKDSTQFKRRKVEAE